MVPSVSELAEVVSCLNSVEVNHSIASVLDVAKEAHNTHLFGEKETAISAHSIRISILSVSQGLYLLEAAEVVVADGSSDSVSKAKNTRSKIRALDWDYWQMIEWNRNVMRANDDVERELW